jgi:mono/diheme cytochrome c family protein
VTIVNTKLIERTCVVATVLGVVAAIVWPFIHEAQTVEAKAGPGTRVITITGVGSTGTWTDAEVRAGNYFAKEFPPARPVLVEGETVLFRFKSADVTHKFYCPELAIGPVLVYPGHVAEVEVTPTAVGAFDYYCTVFCGKPHFRMRGQIVVQPSSAREARTGEYWLEPPPEGARLVDRGAWLYRQLGCFSCHGSEGHGGVRNPNYVKDTVPALDVLAERMFLFYPEDVDAVVAALERRTPLGQLQDDPPVPRFGAVLAKYEAIKELLHRGNPAGKKDVAGPSPPLHMPTWDTRVSDSDMDAIIAYLLTLKPRDESG